MGCLCSAEKSGVEDLDDLRTNLVWERKDKRFKDVYRIEKEVSQGSMGRILQIRRKLADGGDGDAFAMKSIRLNRLSKKMRDELRNEIDILRRLDHPNVIRLYETFEESNNIYLIMEMCNGGDLYDRSYTESDTIRVIKQLLSAVAYLHSLNIVHRDIKFENVVFENRSKNAGIKLIDFGLSKLLQEGEMMDQAVGTIYSMAPEVLAGSYTTLADIWSVGVLTFMLLCGDLPFDGDSEDALLRKIEQGTYSYEHPKWQKNSRKCRAFIDSCLAVKPEARCTAAEALESDWLASISDAKLHPKTVPVIISSMQRFATYGKLRKAAMLVMAHQVTSEEVTKLTAAFNAIDTERDGTISKAEFQALLAEHIALGTDDEKNARSGGSPAGAGAGSARTLNQIFDAMDVDNDGVVCYNDFIAATLEAQGVLKEEDLLEAFDRLDSDNTGYISKKNLRELFGKDSDESQVDEMMVEADGDNDGNINYQEFLTLFRQRRRQSIALQRAPAYSMINSPVSGMSGVV